MLCLETIGESFQPFLFDVWRWLSHMSRCCQGTLCGIAKCRASSTTTAIIAVEQVKPIEVGRERPMFREKESIFSNPLRGIETNSGHYVIDFPTCLYRRCSRNFANPQTCSSGGGLLCAV
ncbi:hypothetical protein AVEN_55802-1 [Araneus ventricosus]|uniref:Uncharacterized protein n=1 Tax=Araneus ventricosus TaxID=182803 RepID=A0A4Y2RQL6_ARAVE|nr:hypothetical protein AVEN_55802-1 [Araneus ventricosus]